MRLITKTTLFYLLLSLLVFGIGGISIYQAVKKEVALETDYALMYNARFIANAMKNGQPKEAFLSDKVSITPLVGVPQIDTNFVFSDTVAMHPQLKRLEPHRKLTTYRFIGGRAYYFQFLEVFIEEGDVLDGVVNIISRLFLILSLVLLLGSFLISKLLFQPFHNILDGISRFNLKSGQQPDLPKTSTKEFSELNDFIQKMTSKARRDYVSLKEFSENASHEMQTPIAVAQGKLELLSVSDSLRPELLELIQSAQASLSKLSKMGKSLSLLTKIENREFQNPGPVDFSKIVKNNVSDFKELSQLKNIDLESQIPKNIQIKSDETLAEILISNLLKNAVQHNVPNGKIQVLLSEGELKISNTGEEPSVAPEQFFERFRKNNQSSGSLGLGLSIVKKICEVNGFEVSYDFEDKMHILRVLF